ncbi:hypothetical protein C8R43DRAFT_886920 [Mycena crocata]|nr:hypothetical protein C8R43DRAFT_886920 [Mycena crocata]
MPREVTANPKARRPYAAQACIICRAKKSKCDGVKPVCGSCGASGRNDECSWGRDTAPRKPRTEAHFEALRKRMDSLQAYSDLLEGILAKCVCQDVSSHLQFRPQQPGEQEEDSEADFLESDDDITQELTVPVQCLKLDDNFNALLLHGITAPFRFGNKLPNEVFRVCPSKLAYPDATYVLLVDGVDATDCDLNVDWSRHLPSEVSLERREHDKILDLSFKFFTFWTFRIVPTLFLRDMHRALSVPSFQKPPRTPYYSPMLHNALLALSAIFSDDPRLRDPKTRRYFAHAARCSLDAECRQPNISLVHALAFLGTYYADIGDRIVGDMLFGTPVLTCTTVGFGVDSKPWVKAGLLSQEEMVGRNWTYWNVFSMDVLWASYFGRDFCGPPSDRQTIPMPFVSSELDQVPWHYAPANIPPQPNYLTLIFHESSVLFVIARKILDIMCVEYSVSLALSLNCCFRTGSAQQDTVKVSQCITKVDLELNNWKSRLPPHLDITLANRAKSTPQRLMLHGEYWWCFIIVHRPFFNRRAGAIQHSDSQIDHVKLCKRAAENILDLSETWSSLYSLRLAPVTMLQTIFSAGTVFLLLALRATASERIAHGSLNTALAQVEECIRYLRELGQAWTCAMRTADILHSVFQDRLQPVIARRLANKGNRDATAVPSTNTYERNFFPAEVAGTPPDEAANSAWAQMPVDFFAPLAPPGAADEFGDVTFPWTVPELDISGFLHPTLDCFTAPELWQQELFTNATPGGDISSRDFYSQ